MFFFLGSGLSVTGTISAPQQVPSVCFAAQRDTESSFAFLVAAPNLLSPRLSF